MRTFFWAMTFMRVDLERLGVGVEGGLVLAELGQRLADPVEGLLVAAMALDQGAVDGDGILPSALQGRLDRLFHVQAARLDTFGFSH